MADYLPKFVPGQAVTLAASTAVVGGRLVEITGAGKVGPAGADSAKVVGVAGFDAGENTSVTVYRGGVQRLTASGAITAGAKVAAAADGKVAATGTNTIGIAITAASADGDVIDVAL